MKALALVALAAACSVQIRQVEGYRCEDGVTCPSGQRCVGGFCRIDEGDGPDGATSIPDAAEDAPLAFGTDPPWWDAAWAYRTRLTIDNQASAPLPATYAVGWHTDLSRFDPYPFEGLRVVRWDGMGWTEKHRLYDDFADDADEEALWFALDAELAPGAATSEYWLYYGNAMAGTPPQTQSMVFPIFYESFATGVALDATKWESAGTIDTVGSEGVFDPGDSIRSLTTFGPGYTLEMKHRRAGAAAYSWNGFQRSADFMDAEPWALWIDWDGTGMLTPDSQIAAVGDTTNTTGPGVTPGTVTRVYSIARFPDRVVFGYEGNVVYERMLPSTYTDPLQIRLRNGSGATVIYFDAVRVRHAIDPEPAITPGPTEQRPP